jgi:hypothetical protein
MLTLKEGVIFLDYQKFFSKISVNYEELFLI